AVCFLDPLSIRAVCRPPRRGRLPRHCTFGLVGGAWQRDGRARQARRYRPHRGAEAQPSASLDRHCARARRPCRAVFCGHPRQGPGRAAPAVVSDMEREPAQQPTRKPRLKPSLGRDALVASLCGFVVVLMVGASYAAVPFYNWFCRVTGFNGTTQVATSAPSSAPLARKIAVRFDANVGPGLPWKFEPEQ